MYKSPEFFRKYIDIMNEVCSHAKTARRLGLAQSTPPVWLRQSKQAAARKDDPSEWLVEIDGERQYFHQWCSQVRRNAYEEGAANMLTRFRDGGFWRERSFQGRRVWQEDKRLIGLGDDVLDMLGLPDRLLRINGEVVPEMEFVPTAGDFAAFMMGSWDAKRYGKKSTVDVNAQVTGGVVFMGGPQQKPQVAAPLPVLQVIEQALEPERPLSDDEPENEQEAEGPGNEPDLSVGDTDPDALPEAPREEPTPAPAPPTDPDPLTYAPGPNPAVVRGGNRPLTPDEETALSRLRSANKPKA